MTKYALVGDVGGTNARLALCDVDTGAISHAETFSTSDYDSLEAVIRFYGRTETGHHRRLYRHRLSDYRRLGRNDQSRLGFFHQQDESQPRL